MRTLRNDSQVVTVAGKHLSVSMRLSPSVYFNRKKMDDQINFIVPVLEILLLCVHVFRKKVMLSSWMDGWMDGGTDEWMMTSRKTDVHEKSEVLFNSLVALLAVYLLFCLTLSIETNPETEPHSDWTQRSSLCHMSVWHPDCSWNLDVFCTWKRG